VPRRSRGFWSSCSLTWRLFKLPQVAAMLHVGAELAASAWWMLAAVAFWAACMVPWCAKYAPVYWRPRADGRPD